MSSSRRNVPIKADHTLAGSGAAGRLTSSSSTAARSLGSRPSTPTLELKRTSPGPRATPSPTPSEKRSSPSLRVKTPSPTPNSLPRRESPSNSQRLSPTLVKARRATPPEEGSPQRASCGTQVDPDVITRKTHPRSPDPDSMAPRLRNMSLRSKSQAGHDQAAISQRVAGLRRPRGASPSSISAAESAAARTWAASDTRDSATQTSGKQPRMSPQQEEISPMLEGAAGEPPKRSEFLFGPIQLQSELGMAIQAALEFTAERRVTYSPSEFATIGRMHLGGDDASDDENAVENLEVRSLSLSEDGPVIARTYSERERQTAAPDPIAMLTHGQQHAGDLEPKRRERFEKDNGSSDEPKHNGSSDLSAAGTENAPGDARIESHEQSLCRNLLPILLPIFEKTAELSGNDPAAAAGTTYQQRFSTRSGPPPTKVRVKSSRARGRTLDLAELKTAGRRGDTALAHLAASSSHLGFVAVRSEFSFGSEHSAFTSVSSPSSQSGSKDSTPQHGRSLRGVASMPTLQQHRGTRSVD